MYVSITKVLERCTYVLFIKKTEPYINTGKVSKNSYNLGINLNEAKMNQFEEERGFKK